MTGRLLGRSPRQPPRSGPPDCGRPAGNSPAPSSASPAAASSTTFAPAAPELASLQLPPRDDRLWPPVRDFLVTARGLDPDLLDRCHRDGLLYTDPRRNAVFLCHDPSRQPTGAEIVGTRPAADGHTFKGMAPGSRRPAAASGCPPRSPTLMPS